MINEKIINVTTLNNYIKNLFEGDVFLSRVYIKGEISNLNKHYTGHYYFTLKDENSKISCMMFSSYTKSLKSDINNGDEVLIFGKVTSYDKGGTYQLYVYSMEPYGMGKYLLQLEELKRKLKAEGLFDRPKKLINLYPKKIAIVTSKTGAAVKDIIHTISSRYPCQIIVFPCLVQGDDAPKSIIKALSLADESNVDTIILARGGGANEDLKAFNDEELVRFVTSLKKPIISAIGHQIDSSIVDLVSDLYCITPTEAGEKSCASKNEVLQIIDHNLELAKSLISNKIHSKENMLLNLINLVEVNSPKQRLVNYRNDIENKLSDIKYLIKLRLNKLNLELNNLSYNINILNPRLAIDKGFAVVLKENKKVYSTSEINIEDTLDILLCDGKVQVIVKEIENNGK